MILQLADAQTDALISKFGTELQAKADAYTAKYTSAVPRRVQDLFEDVSFMFAKAGEFAREAKTLTSVTREQRELADDNFIALGELRAQLKMLPMAVMDVTPDLAYRAVPLLRAPIEWLIAIGTPALQRSAAYGDMARKMMNAPGDGLGWLLDQLRRALKLPSWFVPVVATAAVAGAGYWVWKSFLAPAGGAARLVRRTNPRRRRKRR